MGLLSKLKSLLPAESAFFSGKVEPSSMLFTTPTLNDALPAMSSREVTAGCCFIHEVDWRQFEFISPIYDAQIRQELEAIDAIWNNQSVPMGEYSAFKQVHVRQRIQRPLDVPFSREDFERLFGEPTIPMTVEGWPQIFQDVYAIRLQDGFAYAVIDADRLMALGLEPSHQSKVSKQVVDRLERFITEHDLRLVHWRSRTLFESPASITRWLAGVKD